MGGTCSTDGRLEIHIKFWSDNLKQTGSISDLSVDEKLIVKWISHK